LRRILADGPVANGALDWQLRDQRSEQRLRLWFKLDRIEKRTPLGSKEVNKRDTGVMNVLLVYSCQEEIRNLSGDRFRGKVEKNGTAVMRQVQIEYR